MRITVAVLLLLATLTSINALAQTDTLIGTNMTTSFGTDYEGLSAAICIDMRTDKEKANAIYNWVTHNIAYDAKALWTMSDGGDERVARTLKTKKALCTGYSEVYVALCQAAGLNAVTIDGYAKDMLFDNGDELHIPRHEWAAVKISGKWELVDATWGAGHLYQSNSWLRILLSKLLMQKKMKAKNLKFRFRYDPQYFMQDPETFRLKHLPADPEWQLTDTAMPISVFETGDSAVRKFNELYSKPVQASRRLDELAGLTPKEREIELADRAYAFNHRYHVVIAVKNSILADSILRKMATDTAKRDAGPVLREATAHMKQALDHIKKQKKDLPEEYNKLKKKNKTKSMETKQHIRQIKTDDKRLIAESKKHSKSAVNKNTRARKKLGEVEKRRRTADATHINDIKSSKVQKKPGAAELRAIDDSVAARNARIQALQQDITKRETAASEAMDNGRQLLDSLAASITAEDSMLRMEATERLSMHDSYDDEVRRWSGKFKAQKYYTTDTLMKYYFAGFDSTAVKYELLQKKYTELLNTHKSNVRSLEQYKKLYDGDDELPQRYATCIAGYTAAIDSAAACIAAYSRYLAENRKVFAGLDKLAKRQLKIVEYMERAEKSRQLLEDRTISSKKHSDMRLNERQANSAQSAIKKLQKAGTQ